MLSTINNECREHQRPFGIWCIIILSAAPSVTPFGTADSFMLRLKMKLYSVLRWIFVADAMFIYLNTYDQKLYLK